MSCCNRDGSKAKETREAKAEIVELLSKLEIDQVIEVKDWLIKYVDETPSDQITSNHEKEKRKKMLERGASKLNRIATYLKDKAVDVPSKAPNKLKYPTEGFDSDCTEVNTVSEIIQEYMQYHLKVNHSTFSAKSIPSSTMTTMLKNWFNVTCSVALIVQHVTREIPFL